MSEFDSYFLPRATRQANGCLTWNLSKSERGYGQATYRGTHVLVHRLAYELGKEAIPAGMTIDHLCFEPSCVEPRHLRLLTKSENSTNQRKGYATHCKRGHEYTEENTRRRPPGNGVRDCKACAAVRARETYYARKAVSA